MTDEAAPAELELPSERREARWFTPWLMGLAGMALAAGLGILRGDPAKDVAVLVLAAGGAAALAAALGWWALDRMRRGTVGQQAVVVALVVVVATVAGVWAAAQAMFLSSHDLDALLVIIVAAGSAGLAAALQLGAKVDEGSRAVAALARRIADSSAHEAPELRPSARELDELAAEITEASAALEAARQRERAMEQSRRELIAWISHDLRGPLASIRAMAEALEDGVVDDAETANRYHTATRVETERLGALVDDLFELSRITAGATRMHPEQVPLREVVDDVVTAVAARAGRAGVEIDTDYGELPSLEVSVAELSRALHNLLDNAIRHTPSGGRVLVEGRQRAGGATVTVQDQCGGIPEDDLDRVFDLAFRGDIARSRDGGGGLGLSIARGLVEAHEGSIGVANLNGGCRFRVDLPGLAADPSAPAAVTEAPRTQP